MKYALFAAGWVIGCAITFNTLVGCWTSNRTVVEQLSVEWSAVVDSVR
jgi:hypothetical protein